jgi:hypothetical protein
MLDLAFAAGSVSVFASFVLVPHVVPLASLFLTWVKSLFGRKPAAAEESPELLLTGVGLVSTLRG